MYSSYSVGKMTGRSTMILLPGKRLRARRSLLRGRRVGDCVTVLHGYVVDAVRYVIRCPIVQESGGVHRGKLRNDDPHRRLHGTEPRPFLDVPETVVVPITPTLRDHVDSFG